MGSNFLTFESSLRLQKLGFDEECFAFYRKNHKKDGHFLVYGHGTKYVSQAAYSNPRYDPITNTNIKQKFENRMDGVVTAPLYQQAFKFILAKLSNYMILQDEDSYRISVYTLGKWEEEEYVYFDEDELLDDLIYKLT